MNRGRLPLLALPALAALLTACSFRLDYEKYAIVYGMAAYAGKDYDLSSPDEDALAVAELLAQEGFRGPDDLPAAARIDSEASKANLIADFAAVAARARPDDLFVLYYSGHGGQGPEDPAYGETAPGADPYEEWIFLDGSIVYEDRPPIGEYDPNDLYYWDLDLTVNDDQIAALLRQLPCRRKVVILDACHSGGLIANALEHDDVPPDYGVSPEGYLEGLARAISLYRSYDGVAGSDIAPGNALVLAAAGEREASWESGALGHGLFTYFLLKAPSSADANWDGYVTVRETHRYIRRQIEANWNDTSYGYVYDTFGQHVSGGPVDYVLFGTGR